MNTCIAIFSSRTNTLMFYSKLQNFGVRCKVSPMPTELGSACNVCIEFKESDVKKVKYLINYTNCRAFLNMYVIKIIKNRRVFEKIYSSYN